MIKHTQYLALLLAPVFFLVAISVNASKNLVFEKDILPIFKGRCFKCHSDEKQKGDLRLDTRDWLLKGGESGAVLIPFKPADSLIYELPSLPPNDDDYMPSKGEGLTDNELNILRLWIEQGAHFSSGDTPSAASIHAKVNSKRARAAKIPVVAYRDSVAEEQAKKRLQAIGVHFENVNYNLKELELIFSYADLSKLSEHKADLNVFAARVVALDFSRSRISAIDLTLFSGFAHVQRLDLRASDADDESLKNIAQFKQLQWLNLYGTGVTKTSFPLLKSLPKLRKIYASDTELGSAGGQLSSN